MQLHALFGRKLYRLKETADGLELTSDTATLSAAIRLSDYDEFHSLVNPRGYWQRQPFQPPEPDPTMNDVFRAMYYPLLARDLGLNDQFDVEQYSMPPDRTRLLIYAPLPASMHVQDARFVKQDGFVLYSLDVFEPEPR